MHIYIYTAHTYQCLHIYIHIYICICIHICIYTSGTCAQARSQILIDQCNVLSTTMLSAWGGVGRTDGRTDGGSDGQLKASEL